MHKANRDIFTNLICHVFSLNILLRVSLTSVGASVSSLWVELAFAEPLGETGHGLLLLLSPSVFFFPMYFSTGFFPPADYGDAVFSLAPKFRTLPRKLRRCSLSVVPRRLLGANYDGDAVFSLSPVVCLAQITGMQSFWAGGARMLTFDLFFCHILVLQIMAAMQSFCCPPSSAWRKLRRGCSLSVVPRRLPGANYGDAVFLGGRGADADI